MALETWVQPKVESYQRLKKRYLMPPCLTLSIKRYESRVKWVNPWKGVAPLSTPWCSSYWKGSLRFTLGYGHKLYLLYIKIKFMHTLVISIFLYTSESLNLTADFQRCIEALEMRCYHKIFNIYRDYLTNEEVRKGTMLTRLSCDP